jgi:UDP-sugar pyrophosphorylase
MKGQLVNSTTLTKLQMTIHENLRAHSHTGRVLEYASSEFIEAEEVGLSLFKDCAFVLVAGGLGERLGYAGIKLSLPVSAPAPTTP